VISEEVAFLLQRLIPALNEGVLMSVKLIVPSAVLGLALGVVVGSLRAYGGRILSPLANGYAALFRGTPLVIQLFILYFGLPNIGIYFQPYTAAVLGFILCSAAYHSEYIRGGLLSIKRGQVLAAQALGFSTFTTLVWIIIPQAFRRALPGCGNEIVYLIKYSSLAYVVTCFELTGQAKIVASETFRFSEVFMVVGVYYLTLVTVASWGLRRLEKRLEIPGFGH
jgi:polar amino acid transport system permease protein